MVDAFSRVGVEPLRVGFAGRVHPKLHPYTLDAKIQKHPLQPEVEKLTKDIAKLERRLEQLDNSKRRSKKANTEEVDAKFGALVLIAAVL